jgi:hypothetical protein
MIEKTVQPYTHCRLLPSLIRDSLAALLFFLPRMPSDLAAVHAGDADSESPTPTLLFTATCILRGDSALDAAMRGTINVRREFL